MITVFSKEWFKKYSKAITFVARLPFIGELIFNFKKFGHYVDRKKIAEVTPNSVIEFIGYKKGKVELKQHFFVRNEYALRLQKVFYPIWITFHTWDMIIANNFCPQLNLGFDTLTVYPDASSGETTVDGWCAKQLFTGSFSDLRLEDGSYGLATSTEIWTYLASYGTTDTYHQLRRGQLTFNTSSLTSDATISSVSFGAYGSQKYNGLGSPDLYICASSPSNDNNVVAGDFQNIGTTSFGSKSYASYSTDGYNDITLNASGISNVSKTGISKFGCKLSWDITGDETGLTWTKSEYSWIVFYASDYGSNKPKLVVTYTLPSAFIPRTMWFN